MTYAGVGRPGDVPIVGDFVGDGYTRVGVFRSGEWILRPPGCDCPAEGSFPHFGSKGDRPVLGDWNDDGVDEYGVVRGNTWYLRNTRTPGIADESFKYGSACDPALTLTSPIANC